MAQILIVEDKDSMASMLKETLEMEGHHTTIAKDGAEGLRQIKASSFDIVITDLKLPKASGIEILEASKEENHLVPVIVMTAFGTIESAVNAMKKGAFDFITKPVDTDYLIVLINRALDNQKIAANNILFKEVIDKQLGVPVIIGKSQKIKETYEKIKKVSVTKSTVLLYGESGTGKELFARTIHHFSPRKDYPFVPVNCAAIPAELLESEFFGHEKGAFTGAEEKRLGKFELAEGGTIFLDEIGEMDLSLQSKLLRILQEGEIERVGGRKLIKVDIRVIAATNRELEKAVEEGKFRDDLFYRLNVFPVEIPPLRERKEDIPALVSHFVTKYAKELKIAKKEVSPNAMKILQSHSWKGNVRELENTIERAMILCDGDIIEEKHLALKPFGSSTKIPLTEVMMEGSLENVTKAVLKIVETQRINKALCEAGGNKSRTAEILNISYKTLLTKIKDYSISY